MSTSTAQIRPLQEPVRPPRPAAHWLQREQAPAYLAIAIGVLVRAIHVLSADFPLNDGGLFYLMTEEIQRAGYRIPAFTAYNDAGIPFAYSPAAFYVAAAVNHITGIPLAQLLRFLPLLFASLLLVAVHRLARVMLPSRSAVIGAVLAFALLPRAFSWLIMGGGLTRSLGMLAAVVALHQAHQLYTRREWRHAPGAALACALTVLSHLSTAAFLAFSIALFFAFYGRHRHGLASSVVVAGATVLLTAPWWATVIAQHGIEPFQAAREVSGSVFSDIGSRFVTLIRLAQFNVFTTGEALFPIVGVLAVIGCATALLPGRLIFPVWWVMILLLDARGGPNYAAVPAAMLAGLAIADVLIPGLRALYGRAAGGAEIPRRSSADALRRLAPAGILAMLAAFGVFSALARSPDYGAGDGPGLTALTPGDRGAMRWVAEHTPASSRFLVVTGSPWHLDKVAEWFPVLARRVSVSTVQGLEWQPDFLRRANEKVALQTTCRTADAACLSSWADSTRQSFTHVYVAKAPVAPCCGPLIDALRQDPEYVVLQESESAFIAQRRAQVASRAPTASAGAASAGMASAPTARAGAP